MYSFELLFFEKKIITKKIPRNLKLNFTKKLRAEIHSSRKYGPIWDAKLCSHCS